MHRLNRRQLLLAMVQDTQDETSSNPGSDVVYLQCRDSGRSASVSAASSGRMIPRTNCSPACWIPRWIHSGGGRAAQLAFNFVVALLLDRTTASRRQGQDHGLPADLGRPLRVRISSETGVDVATGGQGRALSEYLKQKVFKPSVGHLWRWRPSQSGILVGRAGSSGEWSIRQVGG